MLALFVLALMLLVPQAATCSETFYRWVDEKGVAHFTDHAPGQHIKQAHGVQEVRVPVNPPPLQPIPSMGSRQQAFREYQQHHQPTGRDSSFKPYQSNHYTDRYQGPQVRQAPGFGNGGPGPVRHGR